MSWIKVEGNSPLKKWSLKVEFSQSEGVLHEEENRRLKRMYAEDRMKAEFVAEALAKKW